MKVWAFLLAWLLPTLPSDTSSTTRQKQEAASRSQIQTGCLAALFSSDTAVRGLWGKERAGDTEILKERWDKTKVLFVCPWHPFYSADANMETNRLTWDPLVGAENHLLGHETLEPWFFKMGRTRAPLGLEGWSLEEEGPQQSIKSTPKVFSRGTALSSGHHL